MDKEANKGFVADYLKLSSNKLKEKTLLAEELLKFCSDIKRCRAEKTGLLKSL